MLRRFLPVALLLAALGAVAAWFWPRLAAQHHGRIIFELATRHADRQGPAWPTADARRLWESIDWFVRNRPDGLRARILEALEDPDPDRREAALVLTSELSIYLDKVYGPTDFPAPGGRPGFRELREFRVHKLVKAHPDVFAAAVRGTGQRAQRTFLYVATVGLSAGVRRAVEDMIAGAGSDDLRLSAMRSLLGDEATPSSLDVLRGLHRDPSPRIRLGALAALACFSDPDGTRDFVAAISHPYGDIPKEALSYPVTWLGAHFASLREFAGCTSYYFHAGWAPSAGLPCDLREPWEAWLALRESEDFAAAPQRARDDAFEDLERWDLR